MRTSNPVVTWSGVSSVALSANRTSDPFPIPNMLTYSAQLVWSGGGSPVGTWKLQASNDEPTRDPGTGTANISGLSNWTDTGDTYSVGADGDVLFDIDMPGYRWARLVYTRTSGTATATGRWFAKGE